MRPSLKTLSLIRKTKSFSFSREETDAYIVEYDGSVYLLKEGKMILKETDAFFYKKLKEYSKEGDCVGILSGEEFFKRLDEISTIAINLTDKCNLDCNICFAKVFRQKEWSIEELKTFLEKIKNRRKLIILTGGEPTTRPDLPEIIRLVVKYGNIPHLYTNGIKLADPEYVKELKKAGLRIIHFTLDGLTDESNATLRGRHGLLLIKLKALKNLREMGMKVILSMTVVDGINTWEIGNMIRFAAFNNDFIKGIIIRPLVPQGRLNIEVNRILTVSDLIKLAENQTDFIDMNYLLEFRRLRYNSYRLIQKIFGKKYARNVSFEHFVSCILKKEGDSLKPAIEYEKLKRINNTIEEVLRGSRFYTLVSLIKNLPKLWDKELLKLATMGWLSRFNFAKLYEDAFYLKNRIRVYFSELSTMLNADFRDGIVTYDLVDGVRPILFAIHFL